VPCHVFEEDPTRANLVNDPGNVWPEVAGIEGSEALAGGRKRLARIAGQDGIHDSAPRAPGEGLEVSPDRGVAKVSRSLGGNEGCAGVFFPLDIAGGGKARLGKLKAHVKAAAACTEGETDFGWWCHVMPGSASTRSSGAAAEDV
jgi:hypothetical protein